MVTNLLPWHPVKCHTWWTCCWSEVSCFSRCKFIYIHWFHCTIKTPKWPLTPKAPIYPVYMITASYPWVPNLSRIFSMDTCFQVMGHFELSVPNDPKVIWPGTLKDQRSQDKTWVHKYTGHFSKFPYLGMELGHWQNLAIGKTRSCTYTLYLLQRVKIELISFALMAAVSEIQADFQNCHIWACTIAIGKIEIELIFAAQAAVPKMRTDFQNCYICA